MAWFSGKVSLGNFPDLAGAVTKISESVKNIEKNFDSALGFEENSESRSSNEGIWGFMGQKSEEDTAESSEQPESLQHPSNVEEEEGIEADRKPASASKQTHPVDKTQPAEEENKVVRTQEGPVPPGKARETDNVLSDRKVDYESPLVPTEPQEPIVESIQTTEVVENIEQKESAEGSSEILMSTEDKSRNIEALGAEADETEASSVPEKSYKTVDLPEIPDEQNEKAEETTEKTLPVQSVVSTDSHDTIMNDQSCLQVGTKENESADESSHDQIQPIARPEDSSETGSESGSSKDNVIQTEVEVNQQANDEETDRKEQCLSSERNASDAPNTVLELEKMKKEMKMLEVALHGAARQSQAKADEIAKLMNENEELKAVIEDLKRNTNEAEIESLREEYHQKVSTLERKVYTLTRERDTLRREQSKKSDAAALLKEKDEIITQVMAEGEELSKKQAAQEGQIRKLRAQVRELEEEKKGLMTKLQVEENKVESIKRDKAATENLLQETIEKHQSELAIQKEYYTNALSAAKEAEALAEARVNDEARTELESRLKEAEEREAMLVQALEELRQTLTRKEQQAVFREDMLRRDIEDFQKRYQASERRCEELITQVPDSTRPLLRQIEAMRENTAKRAEAWAAVERSLNARLQEAEAKAAAAEEREHSVSERLSQTLSRINVLEAQISCLRAEQTQLSRSLEKERQRAAENRQEYLVAKEEADTQEGRVNQLEEQIREVRRKHKQDLQEVVMQREMLQQELEKEKAARLELERTSHVQSTPVEQSPREKNNPPSENGNLIRYSSASSLGSMEESYFLQASLDSSDSFSERKYPGETTLGPYYMKSMTPSAFESSLRQKERELQSYISRLASMESIRDSLAEELVKMTEQCEKLRAEATMLPGVRAELDALRRRHAAALELMGERDEELEELRADIVDLKEMYREQVNLLVNQIQIMGSSPAAA